MKKLSSKVLLLLLFAFSAQAGVNTWTQRGPWGPYVYSLAVSELDSRVVYAGTYTGVYRSTDTGATWQLIHPETADVVLDPNDDRVIYLVRADGLLRSIDSGRTWTRIWNDIVMPVHVDDESRLWGVFVSGQVMMSTDRGAHWETVTPVRASRLLSSRGVLFAEAIEEGRVYRSTDGGGSWQPLPVLTEDTWQIAVSPDAPWSIWAEGGGRLLHTDDGGSTWREVAAPAANLFQLKADGDRLIAVAERSVFVSDDDGSTWAEKAHAPSGGFRLAAFAAGNQLLVGGAFGVKPSDRGMVAGETTFLRAGERLFAGSFNAGTFASDDRGRNWERLPERAMTLAVDGPNVWIATGEGLLKGSRVVRAGNISAIAANGDTVIVSNNINELQVSHDGGETWSVTGHNARFTNINDVAISGNVVYATTWPVQVSLDAGRTWSATNADAPFSSVLMLPDRVLLGGIGVRRAPIGSATFTAVGTGLPAESVIEDFAWNGSTVFASVSPLAGGNSLVYVSHDRGDTWVLYSRQPGVGRITELEAEGKTLWIGTNRGVFELTEGVRKQRAVRK